jgi:anti-anti-sigma factor
MKNAVITRIGRGMRKLRLDFTEVAYLDSTGVGAIIQILQAMKAASGDVVFRGIAGSPRKVLELSNVISIMKIDALEAGT